jgi:outer membrane protein assembly factor BamB
MVNHHGGVVLVGDHIYGFSDSAGGLVCQELKTGKVVWKSKSRTLNKGSVTYADGNLYCYNEDGARVGLVEASPAGFNEKGLFTVPQRSKRNRNQKAWTHPVVANGKLYVRDQEFIYCYDISAANSASR